MLTCAYCWKRAQSDYGNDATVLLNGTNYTVSVPHVNTITPEKLHYLSITNVSLWKEPLYGKTWKSLWKAETVVVTDKTKSAKIATKNYADCRTVFLLPGMMPFSCQNHVMNYDETNNDMKKIMHTKR